MTSKEIIKQIIVKLEDDLQHYTMVDIDRVKAKYIELEIKDYKQVLQDLERLELIEALYNNALKEMKSIKDDDKKLYLKFKELNQENAKLKQENKENAEFYIKSRDALWDLKQENAKFKKVIEVLKRFDFDIYAGKCLGIIQTCIDEPLTFDLEDYEELQDYNLLKEVLGE